jgi:hypothetical protein
MVLYSSFYQYFWLEYEQTADGNTEAYFTLLTLAEGAVLLNGVKALIFGNFCLLTIKVCNWRPNITKPSPPNQIINKRPSIFDTHRRFFGNDFKRFCSAY